MEKKCAFYFLAFLVMCANGLGSFVTKSQINMHVIKRFDEISANEVKELYETSLTGVKTHKLKKFDWSTCSGPNALAQINQLEVSDPLSIPGDVTITIDSNLRGDVTSPLKVSVQVQKKVGFLWVDVPCVDKVGSCDYEDICLDIPFPPSQPCPEPFLTLGLPCNCPVPQGDYIIKEQLVHIPDEHIPQFLARGQYNVRVQASINNQEVVCVKTTFSLV